MKENKIIGWIFLGIAFYFATVMLDNAADVRLQSDGLKSVASLYSEAGNGLYGISDTIQDLEELNDVHFIMDLLRVIFYFAFGLLFLVGGISNRKRKIRRYYPEAEFCEEDDFEEGEWQ